jgi:hypothetical protein
MNTTNEQVVKPVSTIRTRERFNFDRHRRILIVMGAWATAKEDHQFGRISDDEAVARGEALLAELAQIDKLPEYETVIVSRGWTPTNQAAWLVWQKTDGRCTYCDAKLNPFDRLAPDGFHIDHVDPRSKGGSDELDNLTPACRTCNLDKSDRTPEEWRAARG